MTTIRAELVSRRWRRVDIKLCVGADMHVLRWRRGWFADEVLFDERRVAVSTGLVNRESMFGLNIKTPDGGVASVLLSIDTDETWWDFVGDGRPGGVRLETADETLIAMGSLGADRLEPFRRLYDRAIHSLGLS